MLLFVIMRYVFEIFAYIYIISHFQPKHYYFRNIDIRYEQLKFILDRGMYKVLVEVYEGYPYEPIGNYSLSFEIYEKHSWGTGRIKKKKSAL